MVKFSSQVFRVLTKKKQTEASASVCLILAMALSISETLEPSSHLKSGCSRLFTIYGGKPVGLWFVRMVSKTS